MGLPLSFFCMFLFFLFLNLKSYRERERYIKAPGIPAGKLDSWDQNIISRLYCSAPRDPFGVGCRLLGQTEACTLLLCALGVKWVLPRFFLLFGLDSTCPSCRSLCEAPRGGFEFGVGISLFLPPAYLCLACARSPGCLPSPPLIPNLELTDKARQPGVARLGT